MATGVSSECLGGAAWEVGSRGIQRKLYSLLPAVGGDIAGHLRLEVTDDLAQDFLGGAVQADKGTWEEHGERVRWGHLRALEALGLATVSDSMLQLLPHSIHIPGSKLKRNS